MGWYPCCCGDDTCLCSNLGCIEVAISGIVLDSAWGTNTTVSNAIGYVYNKTHAACGTPTALTGGPDFELTAGTCADEDPDSNSRTGCYLFKYGCSSDGSSFPVVSQGSPDTESVITDPIFPTILQILHDTSNGYVYVKIFSYYLPTIGSAFISYAHLWKSTTTLNCSTVNSGSQTLTMSKVCDVDMNRAGTFTALLDDSSATMSVTLYNPSQEGVCLDNCENCGQAFVLTVDTSNTSTGSSTSTQFSLPLINTGTYNFTVDWGDGNQDTITSWSDTAKTHTYSSSGVYTVSIWGNLTGWQFNNSGDKLKPTAIKKWGGSVLTINNTHAFWGCANLDATDAAGTTATFTGNVEDAFRACTSLVSGVDSLDVSGATSLQQFFDGCSSLDDDLSGWDTSSVTDFQLTFNGCTSFDSDIFGQWSFVSANRLDGFLQGCSSFNNASQSSASVNFGSATTLATMLFGCSSFNQSVDNWVFGSATTLSGLFWGATAFNQSLSTWDVSGVSDISNMLRATAFDQSLAAWDVTGITTASGFLEGGSLSTSNYDATLNSWAAQSVNSSVGIHFGSSTYSTSGQSAHNTLTTTYIWTILDSGFVP